jgi:hypothetical protein
MSGRRSAGSVEGECRGESVEGRGRGRGSVVYPRGVYPYTGRETKKKKKEKTENPNR